MKKTLVLPFLLSAVLVAGCASDDAESMVKQTITSMDDTAQVLSTVKDEASAKAAVPRLKELAEKRKKIEEKTATVKTPEAKEQAELQKKYGTRLTEVSTRLMQEAVRVSQVPGGKVALDAMNGH